MPTSYHVKFKNKMTGTYTFDGKDEWEDYFLTAWKKAGYVVTVVQTKTKKK